MMSVDILIVDDSPADRASLRIAFERSGFPLNLHFAASAAAALELLRKGIKGQAPLKPHLMVVDVKMPGISGLDLLRTLKSDEALLKIPVLIYSGSDNRADVDAAYGGFASGYIQKPSDIVGLSEIAAAVGRMCSNVLVFPQL